ncbi:MAG: glycoside hydrolase family 1 protein [Candidatus Portnoybacteria bacterium]|nr:glycoside hydrolase family 1 protein [Candidatus Portnoybacteria bacterium]
MELKFPNGFLWGSATSAHQVEGGNLNDWTEWEKKMANSLSHIADSKKWPDYILRNYPNPLQPENYISGRACDHYNRYEQDFDIAKQLGQNAHRFSIEWSRIEPEEGKFDEAEIEHYRKVIQALKSRGIEPFVTLWHYTHPSWFTKRGGWLHPEAEKSFLNFVQKIVSEFKNEISFWITFNEPETVVRHGYIQAIRIPQERNIFKAFKALKVLARTHNNAYQLIHKIIGDKAIVGFAESLVFFESYNRWPHNLLAKRILNWYRNKQFVPMVIRNTDFIGLNYYFHSRIRLNPFISWKWFQYNENKLGVSDMGWEIYPQGIYEMLKILKKYDKPVFITENGIADAKDEKRVMYIKEYCRWIHKAIEEGVDIKGHFYWSFMDNFEWSDGFWPRFGLIEVDYKTLERKIRPSALEYAKICKNNSIDN